MNDLGLESNLSHQVITWVVFLALWFQLKFASWKKPFLYTALCLISLKALASVAIFYFLCCFNLYIHSFPHHSENLGMSCSPSHSQFFGSCRSISKTIKNNNVHCSIILIKTGYKLSNQSGKWWINISTLLDIRKYILTWGEEKLSIMLDEWSNL